MLNEYRTGKDTGINCGSQVVNIGDEHIFFAFVDKLLQQATRMKTPVDVAVARGIPAEKRHQISN